MLLFVAMQVLAAPPAARKFKTDCGARELARQDCRLMADTYNLRLLKDTVAWNDGTWRTVDDMPLRGEGVQWERASFNFINGWPILQLWIWDAGVGEAKVQSLHWYVADAAKRQFTILASGVVRKRRVKPLPVEEPAPDSGGKPKPPAKPQLVYDAMEPHALKPLKNGGLEWTLKNEKKLIERVGNGI